MPEATMATPVSSEFKFGPVPAGFVLKVSETLLSLTGPDNLENIEAEGMVLGGVNLHLYINSHWSGFERYMLIGQDWTCGFNLRIPEQDSRPENLFKAFTTNVEMFTPHLTGEKAFVRDMTVLTMTASDWFSDETDQED